jgi:glucosyl-dolichyl phosphate glucuronosyltransferase
MVVCTHRRFQLLENAILSLAAQTVSKEHFEVIIVDNDVSLNSRIREMVVAASAQINIRYVHENKIGLAHARNIGGKMASAHYVGYMDDDAKAAKNYIENAINIIKNIEPDYFGGPYFPYYTSKKPRWFKDEYEHGTSAETSRFLLQKEFLNGTNMIYKKKILETVGWFDIDLGMNGVRIGYGEETDFQMRAWERMSNLRVFYSTDLFVFHLIAPVKLKLSNKFIRKYKTGKSQAYLWINKETFQSAQKKAPKELLKIAWLIVFKGLPGLVFRDKRAFPYWQNYAYEIFSKYFASFGQEWQYTKDLFSDK